MSGLAVPLNDLRAHGCPVETCNCSVGEGTHGNPCGGALLWVCNNGHPTVGIFCPGVNASPIWVEGHGYPRLVAHPKAILPVNPAVKVVQKTNLPDNRGYRVYFPDHTLNTIEECVFCEEDTFSARIWELDNEIDVQPLRAAFNYRVERYSFGSKRLVLATCNKHHHKLNTLEQQIKSQGHYVTVQQIRQALSL